MRCEYCGKKFTNSRNKDYGLCEACHYEHVYIEQTSTKVKSPYLEEKDSLIKELLTLYPYPTKTYDKMAVAQLIQMRKRKLEERKRRKEKPL